VFFYLLASPLEFLNNELFCFVFFFVFFLIEAELIDVTHVYRGHFRVAPLLLASNALLEHLQHYQGRLIAPFVQLEALQTQLVVPPAPVAPLARTALSNLSIQHLVLWEPIKISSDKSVARIA
jgi:hypothetical protein